MDLVLASRNVHKTREFRELIGGQFEIADLQAQPTLMLPEETGSTFEENAILKAVTISKAIDQIVIADDSGLEVDALGSAPGIYSARYAGENATDAKNIEKLLRELRAKSTEQKSARFRCVIAVAKRGNLLGTFTGSVEGRIVDPPRGSSGFGYDPIFQPSGFEQTFGEMNAELKNQISHRAKAIAAMKNALEREKSSAGTEN